AARQEFTQRMANSRQALSPGVHRGMANGRPGAEAGDGRGRDFLPGRGFFSYQGFRLAASQEIPHTGTSLFLDSVRGATGDVPGSVGCQGERATGGGEAHEGAMDGQDEPADDLQTMPSMNRCSISPTLCPLLCLQAGKTFHLLANVERRGFVDRPCTRGRR
ncbi:hypothetical protein CYMTET_35844, partial [Cymbomonas tetramitiformis]